MEPDESSKRLPEGKSILKRRPRHPLQEVSELCQLDNEEDEDEMRETRCSVSSRKVSFAVSEVKEFDRGKEVATVWGESYYYDIQRSSESEHTDSSADKSPEAALYWSVANSVNEERCSSSRTVEHLEDISDMSLTEADDYNMKSPESVEVMRTAGNMFLSVIHDLNSSDDTKDVSEDMSFTLPQGDFISKKLGEKSLERIDKICEKDIQHILTTSCANVAGKSKDYVYSDSDLCSEPIASRKKTAIEKEMWRVFRNYDQPLSNDTSFEDSCKLFQGHVRVSQNNSIPKISCENSTDNEVLEKALQCNPETKILETAENEKIDVSALAVGRILPCSRIIQGEISCENMNDLTENVSCTFPVGGIISVGGTVMPPVRDANDEESEQCSPLLLENISLALGGKNLLGSSSGGLIVEQDEDVSPVGKNSLLPFLKGKSEEKQLTISPEREGIRTTSEARGNVMPPRKEASYKECKERRPFLLENISLDLRGENLLGVGSDGSFVEQDKDVPPVEKISLLSFPKGRSEEKQLTISPEREGIRTTIEARGNVMPPRKEASYKECKERRPFLLENISLDLRGENFLGVGSDGSFVEQDEDVPPVEKISLLSFPKGRSEEKQLTISPEREGIRTTSEARGNVMPPRKEASYKECKERSPFLLENISLDLRGENLLGVGSDGSFVEQDKDVPPVEKISLLSFPKGRSEEKQLTISPEREGIRTTIEARGNVMPPRKEASYKECKERSPFLLENISLDLRGENLLGVGSDGSFVEQDEDVPPVEKISLLSFPKGRSEEKQLTISPEREGIRTTIEARGNVMPPRKEASYKECKERRPFLLENISLDLRGENLLGVGSDGSFVEQDKDVPPVEKISLLSFPKGRSEEKQLTISPEREGIRTTSEARGNVMPPRKEASYKECKERSPFLLENISLDLREESSDGSFVEQDKDVPPVEKNCPLSFPKGKSKEKQLTISPEREGIRTTSESRGNIMPPKREASYKECKERSPFLLENISLDLRGENLLGVGSDGSFVEQDDVPPVEKISLLSFPKGKSEEKQLTISPEREGIRTTSESRGNLMSPQGEAGNTERELCTTLLLENVSLALGGKSLLHAGSDGLIVKQDKDVSPVEKSSLLSLPNGKCEERQRTISPEKEEEAATKIDTILGKGKKLRAEEKFSSVTDEGETSKIFVDQESLLSPRDQKESGTKKSAIIRECFIRDLQIEATCVGSDLQKIENSTLVQLSAKHKSNLDDDDDDEICLEKNYIFEDSDHVQVMMKVERYYRNDVLFKFVHDITEFHGNRKYHIRVMSEPSQDVQDTANEENAQISFGKAQVPADVPLKGGEISHVGDGSLHEARDLQRSSSTLGVLDSDDSEFNTDVTNVHLRGYMIPVGVSSPQFYLGGSVQKIEEVDGVHEDVNAETVSDDEGSTSGYLQVGMEYSTSSARLGGISKEQQSCVASEDSVLTWIREELKRKDCSWRFILKKNGSEMNFLFLNNMVLFSVKLSPSTEAVEGVKCLSRLKGGNCSSFDAFREELLKRKLTLMKPQIDQVLFRKDVPTLVSNLTKELKFFEILPQIWLNLLLFYRVQIDGLCWSIFVNKLLLGYDFIIKLDLSLWFGGRLRPENVDVKIIQGDVSTKRIKDMIKASGCGPELLLRFMQFVETYLKIETQFAGQYLEASE